MPNNHPNILLFFCDQLRFDMIHALGNPIIRTPTLDRIVQSGVAFTSAYSPSPVCVPARACMHYGQYPKTCGCYDNCFNMPTDNRPSFMDTLTNAGYLTHGIGKCHFTPDPHALRGFKTRERQEELVSSPDHDEYLQFLHNSGFAHVCDPHGIRGEMYYVPQPAQMPAELHPTNWIGDRSVNFVREQANSSRPWFLFSSFVHPHPPFAPPNPWHKLYRAPMVPLPMVPQDSGSLLTWINRKQNRYKYRDQGIDNNLMRNLRAYYMACVSFIDFQVGRVLAELESTGQVDNTLILFTSDHGEHLGDYNCFGKRSMHDTCARVPLLALQPGRLDGGKRIDRVTSLVDIAPTILGAAGVRDHAGRLDGLDLAEVAADSCSREEVFIQYQVAQSAIHAIVTDTWKYAYSAGDQREYLFDRKNDPQETRNRAGLVFLRDERQNLKQRLIDFLSDDPHADLLDNNDFKQYPLLCEDSDPDTGLLIQDHPWADTKIEGYNG